MCGIGTPKCTACYGEELETTDDKVLNSECRCGNVTKWDL